MKYTLLLLLFFLTSFHPPEKSVIICVSTGAKKYHFNENCRGLKSYRSETIKTSIKKAQGYGLTLCGWED